MGQSSSPSSVAETWLVPESRDSDEPGRAESKPADDALIGSTLLETYEVVRVLGEGGMGRIYEAKHARISDKRFAIKVLRPEFVANAQVRARFEREVEAIARVTHPGVMSIVDVGHTELGWPYMVCEHLSGLDLLAYMRRFGPLPSERVIQIGCRVAEALEATHAQGVIHRDVKPSNVFILDAFEPFGPERDRVKLIDFGLSRLVSRDDQLTEAGIVMGTPSYMAPEQARGTKTDKLTDVYGVGSVLYAAATGLPPFREETPQQTLLAVMSRDPVRPREIKPSISEGLEVVIQRALSKLPEDRYPSMSALRHALADLEALSSGALGSSVAHTVRGRVALHNVRVRLVGLGTCALLLSVAAVASAVSSLIALAGDDFQLSTSGQALLVAATSLGVAALWFWLGRFDRRVWSNTAKLSDWLPRLRRPLFSGLVAYALGSFSLRFGQQLSVQYAPDSTLARLPGVEWPGWGALLALSALFIASINASLLHAPATPKRALRRVLWAPLAAAGAALAVFAFAHFGVIERAPTRVAAPLSTSPIAAVVEGPAPLVGAPLAASTNSNTAGSRPLIAGDPTSGVALTSTASASAGDVAIPSAAPEATVAAPADDDSFEIIGTVPVESAPIAAITGNLPELVLTAEAREPELPSPDPEPADDVAVATSPDVDELKVAPIETSSNPAVAKALMLSVGGPAELLKAVRSIEQLLAAAPSTADDPGARRVVARAASTDGEAARTAFDLMSGPMGTDGPDLLYDLMLTRPSITKRAQHQLTRFRVRKLFTPELAIAYDLRFAPSCSSRLGLLRQANLYGDQRSINVLSALAGKAPLCGRRGRSPCLPLCERESEQFSKSIDAIVRRLRTSEHSASMN